ncbi:hypothetical protein D3C85_1205970 [compost metagenome]
MARLLGRPTRRRGRHAQDHHPELAAVPGLDGRDRGERGQHLQPCGRDHGQPPDRRVQRDWPSIQPDLQDQLRPHRAPRPSRGRGEVRRYRRQHGRGAAPERHGRDRQRSRGFGQPGQGDRRRSFGPGHQACARTSRRSRQGPSAWQVRPREIDRRHGGLHQGPEGPRCDLRHERHRREAV